MSDNKHVCGVDISKDSLDIHGGAVIKPQRIANEQRAVKRFVEQLQKWGITLVVLEATGGYEHVLCEELWRLGIPVARVHPSKVRHFCFSKGYSAKTDLIDAKALYEFGMAVNPTPTPPPSPELSAVRQLFLRRRQLQDMIVMDKNHLKSPCITRAAQDSILKMLKYLTKEVKLLDAKISEGLEAIPEIQGKLKVLSNVKCVGPVLLAALLTLVPELGTLNRRKVAALIGLAPFNHDSGHSCGKRSIRGGRCDVRSILYMASLAAIRQSGTIRTFYQRLVKAGKPRMVALTASMRKFIIYINSVAKSAA